MKRTLINAVTITIAAVVTLMFTTTSAHANRTPKTRNLVSWNKEIKGSNRYEPALDVKGEAFLDKMTGLVWVYPKQSLQSDMTVSPLTFSDAQKACLTVGWGGHLGWRLPEVHEMMSLAKWSMYEPASYLPFHSPIFLATPNDDKRRQYWTNTQVPGNQGMQPWVVTGYCYFSHEPCNSLYIWKARVAEVPDNETEHLWMCVRGPTS